MVNRRSDTDLGNTQSAPRGGERATVFGFPGLTRKKRPRFFGGRWLFWELLGAAVAAGA